VTRDRASGYDSEPSESNHPADSDDFRHFFYLLDIYFGFPVFCGHGATAAALHRRGSSGLPGLPAARRGLCNPCAGV
jgi:hypothetical protein